MVMDMRLLHVVVLNSLAPLGWKDAPIVLLPVLPPLGSNQISQMACDRRMIPPATLRAPSWYNGNYFCNPQAVPPAEAILNKGTPFGICGTQQRNGGNGDAFLNYNRPYAGVYGESVEGIYEPGEVVDVERCANADHGGVHTWRLCNNETIF